MEDEDDENCISMKLVKLLVFTGSHVEFQTWWFQFHAFATVRRFAGTVRKVPEIDLPSSESASLETNPELHDNQ